MAKRIDISGNKYNRWTVISFSHHNGNDSYYKCVCDCGTESLVTRKSLVRERSKSCGCYQRELPNYNKTHGEANKTDEYRIWRAAKYRCHVETCKAYKWYGARGINMCDEWYSSYERFLSDMGRRPSKKHTLDRIDNSKGYSKDNCRWATYKEQANNTRGNSYVTVNGEILTLSQCRDKYNIKKSTLDDLIYRRRVKKDDAVKSLI